MKRTVRFFIAVLIVCLTLVKVSAPVAAQFTPGQPHWQFDPETTQVGRNAERARELIYWIYTHPPIYNVEVLSELWIIVRNITYALTLLVIIGLALHLVLTARRIGPTFTGISIGMERLNLSNIIVRIIAILIFVTFSYIIVRGFIEGAEIATKFIQAIAGEDLFTVVFGTDGNTESNYTFVGYRNYDPYEQDMVFTSLFLVRLTSFTYNFMAVILIMRHIVLMYLLILSPMLGLLMAFIFIRNTGYIWIGVFFQWLFYGPLFTLFIVSLAKIWKAGIPYGFDFSRAIRGEQVFHTGINILYGGPGQVGDHALSPTNTANYIDTYAEYVIALVMLWTAILLPWLLLRIFRDYCCDMMERNNTAIVKALDRFRTLGQPPKPPKPGGPAGATQKLDIELPFRQKIQVQPPQRTGTTVSSSTSDRSTSSSEVTRERVIERINNNEIHTVQTSELQQVYDLKVESLRDVARLEMQKETSSAVTQTLRQIQNPISAKEETTQRQFETIKNEISKRASQGDQAAQKIVNAANSKISEIKQTTQQISSQVLREAVQRPGVPVAVSQAQKQTEQTILSSSQAVIRSVAEKTNTSAEKVEQVLKAVPQTERSKEERITMISERVAVPREQVQKVLSEAPKNISVENLSSATILNAISEKTDVSSEKVEQILKESTATESTKEERVEMIAQQTSIPRSEVQKIVDSASTEQINMSTISSTVAERTDVSEDKVEQVLSQMSESEKSIEAQTNTIAEKIGAPAETVRQIIEAVPTGTSSEQFSSSTVINTISEKTNADRSTVEQVLSQIPQTVSSKEETVTQVAKETGLSTEQVEKIVETAESEREIRESIIQQVSEKTEIEHEKVEQIIRENSQLSTSATSEKTMEQQISLIAEHTGISTEKVRQIGEASRAGAEGALPTVTPSAIQSISEKTETSEENVQEVLKELSQATESKEMTEQEKLQSISEKVGVSQEKVKEVLDTVPMVGAAAAAPVQALVVTPATIQQVAEKTQVGEQSVERILDQFPRMSGSQQEREEKIAEEVGVSAEEVHKVIGATPKAESQESAPGPVEGSPVSIEEYEDVKSMWKNHYQSSEVPVSDMINNREEWIEEDIKTLTNTLDLLSSPVAKNRQKGMEQVSTILPFLLLGGFSDVETMTYIKAKVEAAKNVIEEMKEVQKVTDKIASTEEFVDVESGTTEAVKTMKVEQRQGLPGFADSTSSRKESYETTDRVVERTSIRERIIEKILGNQIHTVDTSELQQAFDLQVKSLKDVARLELNKETNTTVTQVLRSIQNPTTAQEGSNRQQFQTLSTEIKTRAEQGDTQAQRIVEASTNPEEQAAKSAERMPTDTVKQVAAQTRSAVPQAQVTVQEMPIMTPAVIQQVAQKTNLPENNVEHVLTTFTGTAGTREERIKETAEKTQQSDEQVAEVVDATPMEKPKDQAILESGPVPGSQVSIEDYEEVRKMWMNHYKTSEVPESENVKNRQQWIEEDLKTLQNTLDLLSSDSPKDRKKGMENVLSVLPFLLLGGFDEVETVTYVKAKLEAAKIIRDEMTHVSETTENQTEEEFVDTQKTSTREAETMKVEQRQGLPGFADSTSSRKESYETTDRVVERTSIRERIIEKILGNQIHTVDTSELQQAFDLQVKSLKDVARLELNKETNTTVTQVLRSIQNPTTAQEGSNRQQFQTLSTEIKTRAEQGDTQAQRIVEASTNPEEQAAKSAERMPTDTVKQVAAQTRSAIATGAITPAIITSISDKTKIDKTIVEKVLKESASVTVSSALQIKEAAQKLNIPETHVQVIVNAVQETQALAPMIIAKVAEKTHTSHEQVNQILSSVSTLEAHDKEDIRTISEKTSTETTTVESVLKTATIEKNNIEKIAEKTNVSTEKVSEILKEAELQKTDRIEKLSMVTGLSTEQITTIINTANTETGQAIVSVPAPEIITTIAEKTNTSKEEVTKILQTVSETEISETERIERIAQATDIPTEQVQQVLSAVPQAQVTVQEMPIMTPAVIQQVAQKTNLPENNVEHVLTTFTGTAGTREERIKETAEKTQQSDEQVAEVVDATPMEKPKDQAILESGPVPGSQVSIEDYEEVRKMWMNHYKTSEVPESENVKNRQQWIEEDLKTLQNTLDLLSSDSPKDRKKGMENVLSVLPFLLLGGFDEVETVTYVKAKLEAAKIIRDEMTHVSETTENQTEEEFVDTQKTSTREAETVALASEKEQEETGPEVVITTKKSEEKPSDHEDAAHQEPPIMTETTIKEKETIQSASPINDNAVHMVAARVNLPADLVRRIADSAQNRVMQEGIPTTTPNFARTIADTTDASEDDVQSVLSEIEKQKNTISGEDMTLLISTQVNLAQKQVVNIIDTAKTKIPGGDFSSSSPEQIRSIAENTQTTSEQVEQVLSRVSAKELSEDDRDLIISAKTSLPKQLVQSISKAIKDNTYSKAFTDITPSIIASIAQETDASVDHVKEVLDEMAKSIKLETGIQAESSEKPTDEDATHIEDQIAVQVVTKPTVPEEKEEEEQELKSIPVIEKPKEDEEDEEAEQHGDEQPGEETPADTSTEEGESNNNAKESVDQPTSTETSQQDASLQSVTQASPLSEQTQAPTHNPDRSEDTQ